MRDNKYSRLRFGSLAFIIFAVFVLGITAPKTVVAAEAAYSVSQPHVIINQIFGGDGGGYVSHNFIELYNPTDTDVDLTGWSIHYISSPADSNNSTSWTKLELSGTINARSSYLIRCAADSGYTRTDRTLSNYDASWDLHIYNKGCAVLLMSNNSDISDGTDVFSSSGVIDGYVDMLAVAGKDGNTNQIPYESEETAPAYQSKKIGIRRVDFADTDDNSADAEAVNYDQTNVSAFFPRSSADGAWPSNSSTLDLIQAEIDDIPQFYSTYCTEDTVREVNRVLAAIDEADPTDDTALASLLSDLQQAVDGLAYKYDSSIPIIYISTNDGQGGYYGETLEKSMDYVSSSFVLMDVDGTVITDQDGQIKVRGNSTSVGVKKPYNFKLSSGVNLFGMGKSKKWTLLADRLDATFMRNATALKLAKDMGFECAPDFVRVELYIDGTYKGIYVLCEKIEENQNRVDIDSDNGDFLIEMELEQRMEPDETYFSTRHLWRLREPEDISQDQVDAIAATVSEIEDVIATLDYDTISQYIDIPSFVNYYIHSEFFKPGDFGRCSVYFYYKNGKLYAGPTWDYDLSSGNTTGYGTKVANTDTAFITNCHLFWYLMRIPEFRYDVMVRYQELKQNNVFTNLSGDEGWINQQVAQYRTSLLNSFNNLELYQMYCRSNRYPDSTYDENVNFFRNWLIEREAWMDEYVLSLVNGFYTIEGGLYYYENGVGLTPGLHIINGDYYYIGDGGLVSTGTIEVTVTNGLRLPAGTYEFDQNGKMINVPVSDEAEEVAEVQPGCETAGNIRYWYVRRIDKYFKDVACLEEISYEDTIIQPAGHVSVFYEENIVPAQWDEPGSCDRCEYCANCGQLLSRTHVDIPAVSGSYIMMYRLYNPNSGEHFWTGSETERDDLVSVGWNYEGPGWYAPISFGSPVYRLFDPETGDHHYTMSEEERNDLQTAGWNYEGVAWNSESSASGNPLYRLYNPNAEANGEPGTHFFTMSEEEKEMLVNEGWIYEGIGWYAA